MKFFNIFKKGRENYIIVPIVAIPIAVMSLDEDEYSINNISNRVKTDNEIHYIKLYENDKLYYTHSDDLNKVYVVSYEDFI